MPAPRSRPARRSATHVQTGSLKSRRWIEVAALVLVAAVFARPLRAQGPILLEIDLATAPGEVTIPRPLADRYDVLVSNKLPSPNTRYTVTARIRDRVQGPLSLPPASPPQDFGMLAGCPDVKQAITDLESAATEQEVARHVQAAKQVNRAACNLPALIARLAELVAATAERIPVGPVPAASDLVVTVTKIWTDADGTLQQQQWVRTYEGVDRGSWQLYYGFAFVSDHWAGNRSYRSEPTSTDGEFIITPDERRSRLRFVPSIFFSWLPASASNRNVSYVASAGLGFDLARPVVLAAPIGFQFNRNVSVQFGIAALPVDKLKGRYTAGQTIEENLAPDDLIQEAAKSYGVNPFVSLSFNFGSNPFSTRTQQSQP